MELATMLAKAQGLGHIVETFGMVVPAATAVCGWLYHRLRFQRRYILRLHRIPGMLAYKRRLREIYRGPHTELQLHFESLLVTVKEEVGLNLERHSFSPISYLTPLDRDFLAKAIRQLDSPAYRWLCEQLLAFLGQALQSLAEIRMHQQREMPQINIADHAVQRTQVYRDWQIKCQTVEQHLWVMKHYLEGDIVIELSQDQLGPRVYLINKNGGKRLVLTQQLEK